MIGGTDSQVFEITERGINHHNIISNAYASAIGTNCITIGNATESAINFGTFTKGQNGVYTLPINAGSIAIDAGDVNTAEALDANQTSRGNTPDIGAYEFSPATNIENDEINAELAPNPNNGTFILNLSECHKGLLEIYALSGQKIYSTPLVNGKNYIILPSNVKGMVIAKVYSQGNYQTRKMVVK